MTMNIDALWHAEPQQRWFRAILEAFSYPGTVRELGGHGHRAGAGVTVLATLLDGSVRLSDPHGLLGDDDWLLLEAAAGAPQDSDFVLCDGLRAPDFTPRLGELCDPQRGATLVVVGPAVGGGDTRLTLRGPGVADATELAIGGFHRQWLQCRAEWTCQYPLGVDMIVADGRNIAALPRTTAIAGV
jgi:alpha-D-ribose 1-methylphosphonate 5-triphosphate synthase subunit PhnH